MKADIQKLYNIAQKSTRLIVGLMSGTSLDGLDVALCKISGSVMDTNIVLEAFQTIAYTDDFKNEIRKIFAQTAVNFPHVALLNEWIGLQHGQMVLDCLQAWNVSADDVDLIASHGQTVMHIPAWQHQQKKFPNATLQLGDGDHIAVKTGIITISDFRQKHCAAGGEGAPLAVYGDFFVFGKKGENRVLLNMGGIANFTYLPANMDASEVFVTDTGTGNTLLDAFVQDYFPSMSFDKDAALAEKGQANAALLKALKDHSFFRQNFPKTTGPELFNKAYVKEAQVKSRTEDLSIYDLLATLTYFSAETIADALVPLLFTKEEIFTVYMSGGGMHNPLLVRLLKEKIPATFAKTDDLGIQGDAKEAVLFAILANETVSGESTFFGERQGVPSVSMGKISLPR